MCNSHSILQRYYFSTPSSFFDKEQLRMYWTNKMQREQLRMFVTEMNRIGPLLSSCYSVAIAHKALCLSCINSKSVCALALMNCCWFVGGNTLHMFLYALAGWCDEDTASCHCGYGSKFRRIPAPPGSPYGTPPIQPGRQLHDGCIPKTVGGCFYLSSLSEYTVRSWVWGLHPIPIERPDVCDKIYRILRVVGQYSLRERKQDRNIKSSFWSMEWWKWYKLWKRSALSRDQHNQIMMNVKDRATVKNYGTTIVHLSTAVCFSPVGDKRNSTPLCIWHNLHICITGIQTHTSNVLRLIVWSLALAVKIIKNVNGNEKLSTVSCNPEYTISLSQGSARQMSFHMFSNETTRSLLP